MIYTIHHHDLDREATDKYGFYHEIALDTETTGLDFTEGAQLVTCQLYVPGEAVDIILLDEDKPYNLINLFSSRAAFIIHHAPFDLGFLYHAYQAVPENVICTRIAQKLLFPGDKHGLKDLIKFYFGVEIDKSRRENPKWDNLNEEDIEYMCRDVVFLHSIWDFQQSLLRDADLLCLASKICDFLPVQAELQVAGYENIYRYSS